MRWWSHRVDPCEWNTIMHRSRPNHEIVICEGIVDLIGNPDHENSCEPGKSRTTTLSSKSPELANCTKGPYAQNSAPAQINATIQVSRLGSNTVVIWDSLPNYPLCAENEYSWELNKPLKLFMCFLWQERNHTDCRAGSSYWNNGWMGFLIGLHLN